MPQVALSTEFLKAYAAVPKQQQKKVRAFVEKFKADPTQSSIHYEPLHDMADEKVRTVRIGDDYRAVVIHPPQGDVYLCMWVDHHDEAMTWAKNKRFEVNPHTGTLQVWESLTTELPPEPPKKRASSQPPGLFAGHDSDTLLLLGVPEPLLPAVRAIRKESELDKLVRYLPVEATDALYMLAAGYDLETTIAELDKRGAASAEQAKVDTQDFAKALDTPESKRQFKVIETDVELADILDAPLEQWRIFLHPSQRKLVTMEANGPVRVLGGAGTGKTVVAMHRARHLAKKSGFLEPGEQILFTTFTKNLAADVSRSLDLLCTPEERKRIVVKHLHKVAKDLLVASGVRPRIAPGGDEERWDALLLSKDSPRLPVAFYQEEWSHVVQDQELTSEEEYLRAKRTGRGTPLSRSERREAWKVLARYRAALDREGVMEWPDVVREAKLGLTRQLGIKPYRAVVADEVQDFRQPELALLRALVSEGPNDIFVVGDAHQRIYGHHASLGRAGINVRGRRSRQLRINYRTTQQIRSWALALLEGLSVDDLDEGQDTSKGYHSLRVGKPPEVVHFKSPNAEAKHIVATIRGWQERGLKPSEICVAARTKRLVADYAKILAEAGIVTETIEDETESADLHKVRLATMHRVKGLEFRGMIIAGVQQGQMPHRLRRDRFADDAAREAYLQGERHLLYVAATRARDDLVVTGFGEKSEFLSR